MFKGVCYRFHNPRYASEPYSGEGARRDGRRFNRKGVPALYLSLSPTVAFLEVTQGLDKFVPQLIVCYDLDFDNVLDLREPENMRREQVREEDLSCPWETIIGGGDEPPSWRLADRFIKTGYQGMIVPSFAINADPGRHFNIVAWDWTPSVTITHFDPRGDLPKNNSSWG